MLTFSIRRYESMLSIFCNSFSSSIRHFIDCESSVFGIFFRPFFVKSSTPKIGRGIVKLRTNWIRFKCIVHFKDAFLSKQCVLLNKCETQILFYCASLKLLFFFNIQYWLKSKSTVTNLMNSLIN